MIVSRRVQPPRGHHASPFSNNGQLPGGALLKGCSRNLLRIKCARGGTTKRRHSVTLRAERTEKLPSKSHVTAEKRLSHGSHVKRLIYLCRIPLLTAERSCLPRRKRDTLGKSFLDRGVRTQCRAESSSDRSRFGPEIKTHLFFFLQNMSLLVPAVLSKGLRRK